MSGVDDVAGTWELTIRTPIGRQQALLVLTRDERGELVGQARGSAETVTLTDVVQDGCHLSWNQTISRPMRLHLHFEVTITGDRLHGTSRAGRLPASTVSGTRVRSQDAVTRS